MINLLFFLGYPISQKNTRYKIGEILKTSKMQKLIISIDKAVHPNNIIAASTRVAEMLVLQAGKAREKNSLTVKFGEILGNHNSIIHTWQKQIFAGDLLTVFHPETRRYLMTLSEAVQLVLQAVVLGYSREISILDMGETVKILDLAQRFIQMSRYRVNQDIKVILTDLYFGDKLCNKLLTMGEEYDKILQENLLVIKNANKITFINLNITVEALCQAAHKNDSYSMIDLLEQIVPSYRSKSLEITAPTDTVIKGITSKKIAEKSS